MTRPLDIARGLDRAAMHGEFARWRRTASLYVATLVTIAALGALLCIAGLAAHAIRGLG